jgi:hypothetical protein
MTEGSGDGGTGGFSVLLHVGMYIFYTLRISHLANIT